MARKLRTRKYGKRKHRRSLKRKSRKMQKSKKRRQKMRGRTGRSRSKKKGGLNLFTSYDEQKIKNHCAKQYDYDPTKMKWQNVKSIGPENVEAYENCKKLSLIHI